MKQDLNDMAYFSAVVRNKGFTAAGKALGISKSLLSRRVAELESRLGIRLLNRSSRRFSVTELGEQYASQCAKMLEQADLAQQLIDDSLAHPKGRLTISAPVTMTETLLAPLIAEFLKKHEDVQIDLLAINRDVDLIEEGIDIAIRAKPSPLPDSDLHLRVLGRRRDILVASPAFVADHPGMATTIHNLKKLPTLTRKDNAKTLTWTLEHATEGHRRIDLEPRLAASNLTVIFQAAIEGVGIALLPQILCRRALAQGVLRHVFEGWHSQEVLVHAVFASNRGSSPAFRAFMDHLARYFDTPGAFLGENLQQGASLG